MISNVSLANSYSFSRYNFDSVIHSALIIYFYKNHVYILFMKEAVTGTTIRSVDYLIADLTFYFYARILNKKILISRMINQIFGHALYYAARII